MLLEVRLPRTVDAKMTFWADKRPIRHLFEATVHETIVTCELAGL